MYTEVKPELTPIAAELSRTFLHGIDAAGLKIKLYYYENAILDEGVRRSPFEEVELQRG
jgi:hypothetical protein